MERCDIQISKKASMSQPLREISSGSIHRNSLTQKQANIIFVEETEDDDEQFILNMKTIIDKNCKMQNKENSNIKDLQSKLYLSRKKKCPFSDIDQNLMKRFKKSVDDSKASCITQKLQQPEHVVDIVSTNSHSCSTDYTPQIAYTPVINNDMNDDMNCRHNKSELLFHVTSKMQKNDQWIHERTVENIKTVTEIEIEKQFIYKEMLCLTPPQKDDS
ncbi:PREDICTED: uncharacterized protein LOC105449339 isoform X2 [Wasmannia auropunctata]|uniref:uncharacterized protein LOC105449339 isoform X2 n=1 Tax=Wasmannia auropunctata TaxID=64793 RepID=UPI0005F05D55|nr:PREDICTED: uncharacterized protein LOC105449339 isoform X2 [Wasmannia auropunctata]XP_011686813.1 PREDICTED: uncharacterized protein LOC105449339 isoform X2 [Wasmannia auropunctata]